MGDSHCRALIIGGVGFEHNTFTGQKVSTEMELERVEDQQGEPQVKVKATSLDMDLPAPVPAEEAVVDVSKDEEAGEVAQVQEVKAQTSVDAEKNSKVANQDSETDSTANRLNSGNVASTTKKKFFQGIKKDYYKYLKQAYHFSTASSPSRLQLLEKKGTHTLSKVCKPRVTETGLDLKVVSSKSRKPRHFSIRLVRAQHVPGTGKILESFHRVARMSLFTGSKFLGNNQMVDTVPVKFENKKWRFSNEEFVVRYEPKEKLKLYIELNFQHQIKSSDRKILNMNDKQAAMQVTEVTVAWCKIPIQVCSELKEETVIPVKLVSGSLSDPVRLDDLRHGNIEDEGEKSMCSSCIPQRHSLLMVQIKPLEYNSQDFRYLPSNFICGVNFATVITLYRMILAHKFIASGSYTIPITDPVLVTFPHVLNCKALRQAFLKIWQQESPKYEQV